MVAVAVLIVLVIVGAMLPREFDSGVRTRRILRGEEDVCFHVAVELEKAGHHVWDVSVEEAFVKREIWKHRLHYVLALVLLIVGVVLRWEPWLLALFLALILGMQGVLDQVMAGYLRYGGSLTRRTPVEWVWYAVAAVSRFGIAWGACWLALTGVEWMNDGRHQGIIPMVAGVVLLMLAHLPAAWLERHGRSHSPAPFADDVPDDAILWLRSFSDDQSRLSSPVASVGCSGPLLPGGWVRFEEALVDILRLHGPVVAIGRPGEPVPELGALRTYWPDDQWQDAVRLTAHRCRAIVLLAGASDGLVWELEHLRDWGLLGKTLVILPPDPDPERFETRLEMVLKHLAPQAPPCDLSMASVVWTGVRALPNGTAKHYISEGHDWEGYLKTALALVGELRGTLTPLPHGEYLRMWRILEEALERATSPEHRVQVVQELNAASRPQPNEPKRFYSVRRCEQLGVVAAVRAIGPLRRGTDAFESEDYAVAARELDLALHHIDRAATPCWWGWVTGLKALAELRAEGVTFKAAADQVHEALAAIDNATLRIRYFGTLIAPSEATFALLEDFWDDVEESRQWESGLRLLYWGFKAAKECGDGAALGTMHVRAGQFKASLRDWSGAAAAGEQAREIANSTGNVDLLLDALCLLIRVSDQSADWGRSDELLEQLRGIGEQAGHEWVVNWIRSRELRITNLGKEG